MSEADSGIEAQFARSRLVGYPFFPDGPRTRLHLKRDGIRVGACARLDADTPEGDAS